MTDTDAACIDSQIGTCTLGLASYTYESPVSHLYMQCYRSVSPGPRVEFSHSSAGSRAEA